MTRRIARDALECALLFLMVFAFFVGLTAR